MCVRGIRSTALQINNTPRSVPASLETYASVFVLDYLDDHQIALQLLSLVL